ncbi:MAG: ATP-dependent helicase [Jatrophihabitans sp.]|uniref:ATP-dependent helicase n=1 Tax=Jatrophihabitans sp. TaxID=1932789 RepID=UPI0039100737
MNEPAYRLVRAPRPVPAAPHLDAAQRAVVEHRGGPLLVLAGPGTGKTTTLVEAAVQRVERGVPVDDILMLTFSRRAAGEMRDRVTARLARTIREPIARTLHSYAFGVLRLANRRGADLGEPLPPPRLLSGAEQDIMLRDLVEGRAAERWPAQLRPALRTRAFAGELRDLLMRAVERGLDGPALVDLGRARSRDDWIAAGEFLTEYQNVSSLAKPGAYDPSELIRSALNALHGDPELLAAERAHRRHLFVDEYQDTDPAQAELLALLAEGADELVVVGDPDQSIYAFRGADASAIHAVDERFGAGAPVPVVALGVSRRSGADLLAASRRIAGRLPGRAEQRRLQSAGDDPGRVDTCLFRTASEEAAYLAGVLRRAHLDGLPWSRMAVVVRSTTGVLATLRRALITAGVPVVLRDEDLPLAEQPAVAVLLEVLRLALEPGSLTEDAAERLLLGPVGGADVVYVQRLRRVLRQRDSAEETALLAPAVLDPKDARGLPDHVKWPVVRVAGVLAAGRDAVKAKGSSEDVLWAIWDATSLARRWAQQSAAGGGTGAAADRDLDAVVALFDAAARFTDRLPRSSAREFAEHLAAQQIPGDTLGAGTRAPDAVAIVTAHASKGLEWDLVCVAHVQEGSWPDLRRRGSLLGSELLVDVLAGRDTPGGPPMSMQLAEERRLFYVAVTRARQRLVVSAVAGEEEQPSRFLDELDPVEGDRPLTPPIRGVHLGALVAELRAAACDPETDADLREAAAAELARLAAAGVRGADPAQWWGLAPLTDDGPVADPDRPVPVSPSRIDSFLRCEVRALLQDVGARDGEQISASLGTLVHEIAATAPPDADLPELERLLDEQWGSLDFGAQWFALNERRRASRILARLVEWMRTSRAQYELVGIERAFTAVVGDAVLTGRVDRVERDSAGRLVVVDLKTGKSKVRSEELPLHPQLGAYQLAVEAGAFGDDERSGGALLVQLAASGKDPEQFQPPLSDAEDPDWITRQVDHVAGRMRGSEFTARVNSYCGNCDLQKCCPLQSGRQVTT